MGIITEFREIAADPYGYARRIKREKNKRVIGYFCTYAPEELIYAAGAHPMRLFGSSENVHLADAHLQAYSCSLVRGALEEALNGNLSFLDGAVFPHTCDSIQRLSDIWRMNTKFPVFCDVVMPVKLDTDSAREYMRGVIEKFRTDLEGSLGVKVTRESMDRAVRLFNDIRGLLKKIYRMNAARPGSISGSDLNCVVRASMIMDRDGLPEKLRAVIAEIEKQEPAPSSKKRLVLSGGVCTHPDVYSTIEAAGGSVVWDDLCSGSRYFEGTIAQNGDPLTAVADRYSGRIICPAKHISTTTRGENLVRMAKENGARGVIFMFLKFCDPHSWDYPYMREMLSRENIPSMLIEIEDRLPAEGQLRTRFEAFVEML